MESQDNSGESVMPDIFSQIDSIIKERGIELFKNDDENNNKTLLEYRDKMLKLGEKMIAVIEIIDYMINYHSVMCEDKQIVFEDFVNTFDIKISEFSEKSRKLQGALSNINNSNIEDIQVFMYEYNDFINKTFTFLDEYFWNGYLSVKLKDFTS